MREEEASRYLSPLVKQDLAKLNSDGDTRSIALKSLKLFVEQLDVSTLPRFISQIAESREPAGTRSYAISLYEEAARVHGKLIIPSVSKMMSALVKSSSASGSFPQLQVACARVTSAIARYSIDSSTSQIEAEKIVSDICGPLTDALAGKLEPVAANAATCIHALVESEIWKYAQEAIIHEVCQRTTAALSEKPSRTVAHMQLACTLASANPDFLSVHGACLLRIGEDILKSSANSWQLRKAAAKLLQSVLTILDKKTLETELPSALHVLEICRADKMTHVRTAVSEALHIAKMLSCGGAAHKTAGVAAGPIRKPAERIEHSLQFSEEIPVSPVSKRGTSPRASMGARAVSPSPAPRRGAVHPRASMSPIRAGTASPRLRASSSIARAASLSSQESHHLSYSSASTSTSESVRVPTDRINGRSRVKRAPLYPPRGTAYAHSPRSAGIIGTSPTSSTTTVEECESPSRKSLIAKEIVRSRSTGAYLEDHEAGFGDNYLRSHVPLISVASTPILITQFDALGTELKMLEDSQDFDIDAIIPEDSRQSNPSLPRLKLGGTNSLDQYSGRVHANHDRASSSSALSTSMQAKRTNNRVVRSGRDAPRADGEVEKREIFSSDVSNRARSSAAVGAEICTPKVLGSLSTHVEEKRRLRTTAKKIIPFVPPTRLVRSLSSLSNPESRGGYYEQDDMLLFNDADAAKLDAESSSEAGWSVRDNPIASEESYRSDTSDQEFDEWRKADDFPRLRKVGSIDASPRDIHMISPDAQVSRSVSDGATLDHTGRGCNPAVVHSTDRVRISCVSAEENIKSCTVPVPSHPKDVDVAKPDNSEDLYNPLNGEPRRGSIREDTSGESEHHDPISSKSPKQVDQQGGHPTIRMVRRQWKKLCWYTEAVLGGSLFVVLAVPVVMVVVRALTGSHELEGLVPT